MCLVHGGGDVLRPLGRACLWLGIIAISNLDSQLPVLIVKGRLPYHASTINMTEPSGLISQGSGEDDLSPFGPEEQELIKSLGGGKARYVRMILAAIGSIPWFGLISIGAGLIGAAGGFVGDRDQDKTGGLWRLWIQEHRERPRSLLELLKKSQPDSMGSGNRSMHELSLPNI